LPERRGAIDVVLAPRGAAKTTLLCLVFPLHALLYRLEGYILILCATQRQARARLANLRAALAGNRRLAEVFGEDVPLPGRSTLDSITLGETRLEVFSAGSELRGLTHGPWRPTWIILDDVESGRHVHSPPYRDRLHRWMLEVIENLGNGYTHIDLIGTLLHADALPARLRARPDVQSSVWRSILTEAERQDLWEQWRLRLADPADPARLASAHRFFLERQAEMLAGANVLWPEKESYYDLQVMRATRGRAAFDQEKQNEPPPEGRALFPIARARKFTRLADRLEIEPRPAPDALAEAPRRTLGQLRLYGFLDPALGEPTGARRAGDFAAIVTVGVDDQGYLFVLDAWLERVGPSAQIARVFELFERWGFAEFGVETNAFQKLLLEPLERERAVRRLARRPWSLSIRPIRHRAPKRHRILRLEPLIESGWLLFADDLPEIFMRQLSDFPHGPHDDGPDALAAAVELARGARTRPEPAPAGRPHPPGLIKQF